MIKMNPTNEIKPETGGGAPTPSKPSAAIPADPASSAFEWIELVVYALSFVLLVMMFVARHSPVIGTSMAYTLAPDDILIISNLFYEPQNGDIIVFQSPGVGYDEPLVKRVIAKGGQVVNIDSENWTVMVDGEKLEESYITRESGSMFPYPDSLTYPMTVPEGYLFVMGDNRRNSLDSRSPKVGLVDERFVIGRVVFRLFPFDKLGKVS